MAYVMMMWGKYAFGINNAAYQQLQRSNEWRWPSQELYGRAPRVQFTGEGDDTITLPGVIYPEWRGGVNQIEDMRALAGQADPQLLIDGRGNILGLWAALSIAETQSEFGGFGLPRKQEFILSLKHFPDPLIGGNVGVAALSRLAKKLGIDISAIKDAIQKAQSAMSAIKQAMQQAQAAAQAVQSVIGAPFAAINSASKLAQNVAGDFKTMVQNAQNIAALPATMAAAAVANANAAVQTIVQATPSFAIQARHAADSLKTSLQAVVDLGVAPAGVIATQACLVAANKQSSLLSKTFHSMRTTVVT